MSDSLLLNTALLAQCAAHLEALAAQVDYEVQQRPNASAVWWRWKTLSRLARELRALETT